MLCVNTGGKQVQSVVSAEKGGVNGGGGELWRVRWWRGDVVGQEVKQRYNVTADWE